MALLSPGLLQAVVAIGEIDAQESMSQTATGFLYASDRKRLWLVTCKHAVEPEAMVRLNRSIGDGTMPFCISQGKDFPWTMHPKADVAVIPAPWMFLEEKGVQWKTFAKRELQIPGELDDGITGNALNRADAIEAGLSEGCEVFVLGFPVGWRDGARDYPLVRHGMLSQVRGWLDGNHDTILVDGSGFPGNSGGPVVTKPEGGVAIEGTKHIDRNLIVGMVAERRFSPIGETVETADLIEVVPMDLIDETIEMAVKRMAFLKEVTI